MKCSTSSNVTIGSASRSDAARCKLVDDYLELRPTAEPRIRALVEAGRLHVAPGTRRPTRCSPPAKRSCATWRSGCAAPSCSAAPITPRLHAGSVRPRRAAAAALSIDGHRRRRLVARRRSRPAAARVQVGRPRRQRGQGAVAAGRLPGSGRRLPSDREGFADAVERTLQRLGDWIGEMPILFPVGDDHVRLATWLPGVRRGAAQEAARRRGAHRRLPRSSAAHMGVPTPRRSRRAALAGVRAGAGRRGLGAHSREAGGVHRHDAALAATAEPLMTMALARRRHWLGLGRAGAARLEAMLFHNPRRTTRRPAAA